jgi:hypothetical protein
MEGGYKTFKEFVKEGIDAADRGDILPNDEVIARARSFVSRIMQRPRQIEICSMPLTRERKS